MSLYPLSSFGLNDSLIGVADATKITDSKRNGSKDYSNRRFHELSHGETIRYTIIITCISAILFVTIVSIYDVLHNVINVYYNDLYLNDPHSHISQEDIERTKTSNKNTLIANCIFALICIVSAVIFVPLLLQIIS